MPHDNDDLDTLRRSLASDPKQRARLLVGLGDALAERGAATTGPRGEMVAAAATADERTGSALVAGLVATGALLYAAPVIASRVVLAQVGSETPTNVLLAIAGP